MEPVFVIFCGFNERAVLAFIRTLECQSIDYWLIANGKNDRIFLTSYAHRVAFIRETPDLSLASVSHAIETVLQKEVNREIILAPSTEAINRLFLEHHKHFNQLGVRIPLVAKELYERISNKQSFGDLCASYDFLIPDNSIDPGSQALPFVAKPIKYDSLQPLSPVIVNTEDERLAILKSEHCPKYYFQEFIDGRSLYLLLHISCQGEVVSFSQENLIQQPDGKSIIAAIASDFHLSEESLRYSNMLKSIGYSGLIMIEIRQNGADYFMIEANPRLWGPSQLFVDSMDLNLFDCFLADQGFNVRRTPKKMKNCRYYWHEGFVKTLTTGAKPVYHNYTPQEFALDLPAWLEADLYRRKDTLAWFVRTIQGDYQ